MEIEKIWQDYGLDRLEEGIQSLFPSYRLSAEALFSKVIDGDITGAAAELFHGMTAGLFSQLEGMKNIFIWLLVLGILSSLMTRFVEIFDRHQVADLGFYFMYLLFSVILLQCFRKASLVAAEALENIVLFIRLLMPTYLFTVGVSTGSVTAGAAGQLMLLAVYGVENVLGKESCRSYTVL